jgi:hypothetical protein
MLERALQTLEQEIEEITSTQITSE